MARREWIWLGTIAAIGAALRFATLDLQGFHHDEAVTAGRVLRPGLGDTLGLIADSERSPPLYYLLAWGWSKAFGTGEVGLRSLSALLGTAAIPAAWFAVRELATRRAGLVAAALVALSPILIWYSQEARSYGLFLLFSALSVGFFARAARDPRPRSLWLWAATAGLALLSHYFAVFLICAQALILVRRAGSAARLRAVAAAASVAAVGLALVPLAVAQQGDRRSDSFRDRPLEVRALEVAVDAFAGEEPNPFAGERETDLVQGGALAAGGLATALALISLRLGSAREREGAALAGVMVAAAAGVPLVLALAGLDFANPRNMVGASVPLLCVIAIGFGAARAGRLGLAAAGALCVAFAGTLAAAWSLERMQRDDWRSVAEAIGPGDGRRVLVINHNGDDPVSYYLGAESFEGRSYERRGPRARDRRRLELPHDRPARGLGARLRRQGLDVLRARLPPVPGRARRARRPRGRRPPDREVRGVRRPP